MFFHSCFHHHLHRSNALTQFLETHGWPIVIWGTVEKAGKNDFSGRVSFWAIIARTFKKHDGSPGTQKIFVTGGDRSGLDEAREGIGIICSAVYQEGKNKSGTWTPRPWVTSSTVLPAGAPLPPQYPHQGNPPAQTQPTYQAPYQQQHHAPQMPPPNAQHHQTGNYNQHIDIPF